MLVLSTIPEILTIYMADRMSVSLSMSIYLYLQLYISIYSYLLSRSISIYIAMSLSISVCLVDLESLHNSGKFLSKTKIVGSIYLSKYLPK